QFQDSTTRYELIVGAQSGNLNPAYLIILAITSLHPITYALLGLVQLVRAIGWRWHRSEQSVRLLGLFLISLGLVSLLLLVGFAFSNGAILFTGAMCAALILPGLYILGRRYPYFFDELQTAVERSRYRNSQLKGKDLSRIERSLKECMVAQEVFKEEDLSLPELAACVQLSPHQLSEYFNVHLNLNFSRFINQYRIREACKMLVEHPDMTVLNIAFSVGFNSKSVFNAAFLRETGLTPTTYRSKNVVRQG
ncbi:MAG TPA: hypothetical protein DEA96_16490, partial [Leptospiraceae bacterium]|nr:hypothetical protein [Leptospiraceae bacterium]